MIIDMNHFRPKNESYEHYILKQVGRAFLFRTGTRICGCEVELIGNDHSPYGEKKVVDVVGVDRRRKPDLTARKLLVKIQGIALTYGIEEGITEAGWNGSSSFLSYYRMKGEERTVLQKSIDLCYDKACVSLGYPKGLHKKLNNAYKDEWQIRSVESKATISDYRNGYSMSADFAYLIAPMGVIPKEELPKKVGLLEFDFDKYHETRNWEDALVVTKKPRKEYDSMFHVGLDKKKGFKDDLHSEFCEELLFTIGQQNTEEATFWNVFLRVIQEGYTMPTWSRQKFEYEVGDETPLGIIIDRRLGKNPDYDPRHYHREPKEIPFYKTVVVGEGISKKWISERIIEKSFEEESQLGS